MRCVGIHVALTLAVALTATAGQADQRPNIVFILADDLGWTDLGVQGSRYYETPHIDQLAADGMRFTCYHNCQNCAPTRAALISGQYGARTGVYTVGSIDRFAWRTRSLRPVDNVTQLPLDRITIAQSLHRAGYVTGMFGKWHLSQRGAYHPAQRGFDEAIVSAGKHFDFQTDPPTEYPEGQYLADFLTDRAVDFIRRHAEKPFFLYLPHFAVHSPWDAKPECIEKFRDKTPVGVIQVGDWKLMEFYEDGRLELYNLREDIGESHNLAAEMPDKARQLQQQLAAWRRDIHAPMPTPHDPASDAAVKPRVGKKGRSK